MSRVTCQFSNDEERLQELSNLISLERLGDLAYDGGYVLHDSSWWRVVGPASPGGVDLEIAGPDDTLHPRTAVLRGDQDALVVYAAEWSGLQFQEGVLLDTRWPVGELIYVADARCRGAGNYPDEKVYGIFSLRFDEDGDSYYAPVDPEFQPGVASSWLLSPYRDLILDWRPVDVYDLLSRMGGAHGQV